MPPGPAGDAIPYGELAGRVGAQGKPFGIKGSATAGGPGELYLVYNDCAPPAGYGDNGGSVKVHVTGDWGTHKSPGAVGIDWTMPDHMTGAAEGPFGLPGTTEVFPKTWKAKVFLTNGKAPATCGGGVRWKWKVTPPAGAKLASGQPKPGCSFSLEGSKLGSYSVTATEEKQKHGKWTATGHPLSKDVKLRDFVIVGLGDSNGSGEGNPPFYYPRCDRSTASYQYRAALYVEKQDPRSSVTFIHASCSGARIDHVVSTPYDGIEPETNALRPQVDQVLDRLDTPGPTRKVDAAIVSAGVNDLAFGPLMAYCVKEAGTAADAPCEELNTVPTYDAGHRVDGWKAALAPAPTLRSGLATLQGELLPRYNLLASRLDRLGVPANHVIITRYPDFTNGDDGKPCGPTGAARLATSTWTFLSLNASILDRTVAKAASVHGWKLAPIDSGAFATRGYCSSKSLIVGIVAASAAFDPAGPFHPNREAHQLQAKGVEPKLCTSLGLSQTCEQP